MDFANSSLCLAISALRSSKLLELAEVDLVFNLVREEVDEEEAEVEAMIRMRVFDGHKRQLVADFLTDLVYAD